MQAKGAALPDRAWALCAGVSGIAGVVSYALLIAVDTPPAVSVLLATAFGFGFSLASISLHLGVTGGASPRLSLLAAVANTAAAVELIAMALVQIAVRAVEPHPGRAMIAIWLGLDVAWDVFGGAGTVLFGFALLRHPRVGRVLGVLGILLGAVLLALNIGTFPAPPAEAGWIDVGPFVALWYVILLGRVLWLAWPAAAPPLDGTVRAAPVESAAVVSADEALTGAGADR